MALGHPLKRLLVPVLVPAAGAMAFYLGGMIGAWMTAGRFAERPVVMFLAVIVCGAPCALAGLLGSERALAPESSSVDTLRALGWIVGAAALVLACRRFHGLHPVLEHLLIWGAGMYGSGVLEQTSQGA